MQASALLSKNRSDSETVTDRRTDSRRPYRLRPQSGAARRPTSGQCRQGCTAVPHSEQLVCNNRLVDRASVEFGAHLNEPGRRGFGISVELIQMRGERGDRFSAGLLKPHGVRVDPAAPLQRPCRASKWYFEAHPPATTEGAKANGFLDPRRPRSPVCHVAVENGYRSLIVLTFANCENKIVRREVHANSATDTRLNGRSRLVEERSQESGLYP